jgi:SecD/SecF fusion protein
MDDNFFQLVLAAEAQASFWAEYPVITNLGLALAVFVLPFVLSRAITKSLRLPTLTTRMGFALAATIAAALLVTFGKLGYGPDMQGGTTLIYNIVEAKAGEEFNAGALASALSQRVDPSGTKEISIRPRGADQIEITVPTTDTFELQRIKDSITAAGQLEFRVVANTRDHDTIIQLARAQGNQPGPDQLKADVRDATGRIVGRWYNVGRSQETVQGIRPLQTQVDGDIIRNSRTGQIIVPPPGEPGVDYPLEKYLKSAGIESIDVLMALELNGRAYTEVFGDDLDSAQASTSNMGEPNVSFRLSGEGAGKMLELTTDIMPEGNFFRRMAIIMDKNVLSAPQLRNPISSAGVIEGRFTKAEVDFLSNILRAGRLPATLEKEPASESRVGAGLGETTIAKGKVAAITAVIATAASMLIYYHFSGVVATIALALNVMMIFGVMIFIRQPLSLPGLAGIVLTIGMAVDSNVLIFERIREERAKGSADRLAIRNGFDRATATIVDSNLTTLIAALVLYWIGTEQVRGFAVTLTIGIVCSMFTAVFCSRILFEIAEKLKLVSLSMVDGIALTKGKIVGQRDIDYMSIRGLCIGISLVTIALGMAAVFVRGNGLLNIDFTGGTSVTLQLQQPVPAQEMREIVKQVLSKDSEGKNIESSLVRVDQDPQDTVYVLTTSLGSEQELAEMLNKGLAQNNVANLITYKAKVSPLKKDQSQSMRRPSTKLVSTLVQESPVATTAEATQESTPATPPAATPPAAAGEVSEIATTEPARESATFVIELSQGGGQGEALRDLKSLKSDLAKAAEKASVKMDLTMVNIEPNPRPMDWLDRQSDGYSKWNIELPLSEAQGSKVIDELAKHIDSTPIWLSLSQIKGRVANEMQQRALTALIVAMFFIVAYIWFRFQKISYGIAAVVALVHDVLITTGVIAVSHWVAPYFGFLLVEDFKIGLTEIAAFLAIIGYSLNDTIVVFDRIRELRGRSPNLTLDVLNKSLNQTLSRTILTSGTTLLTVFVLYVWGGEGIHTFAFALLVGITVGTYSSLFIATPVLYWLVSRETSAAK